MKLDGRVGCRKELHHATPGEGRGNWLSYRDGGPSTSDPLTPRYRVYNMTPHDDHITHLVQFTDSQVLEAFRELHNYLKVRGKHPVLNCRRLVTLLRTYCTLLLDSRSDLGLFTMRVGPTWHQLSIDGHDSDGNKKPISIKDGFRSLVDDISRDLLISLDNTCFESLIKLFTAVIEHPRITIEHKFILLNAENGFLKSAYDLYIWDLADTEIEKHLGARKDFILECINAQKSKGETDPGDVDLNSLCDAYKHYVSWLVKRRIGANQFPDVVQFLYNELQKCNNPTLGTFIIWNIITYNHQFLVNSKTDLERKVAEFGHLIQEDKRDLIAEALKFSPADIDLRDHTVELGSYDLTNIDFRTARTYIYATIPIRLKIGNSWSAAREGIRVDLRRVTSPVDDPIYAFLTNLGLSISGMPLALFSDVLQDSENSTLMTVVLDTFYNPDFAIVNGRIVDTDFGEIEALRGRQYYPHKERIVSLLRDIYDSSPGDFPFDISKAQINIDMISNFLVNYVDEHGKGFFHKVYTVTNPDSFIKIKTRYLDKVSRLNLGDEFLGVRDLTLEAHIFSSSSLCDFVFKAIEIIVKKSVELRGLYRYLWIDGSMKKPLAERDVQPLIKSHIQPILEEKGVQISREVIAANGSLDYLCSYTRDDKLYKVGIELKNAHHPNLIHGLTKQLPAYLQDEGTREGIYLVLWYKTIDHPLPSEYSTSEQLGHELQNMSPAGYHIRVMVIDCTRKPAPSSS